MMLRQALARLILCVVSVPGTALAQRDSAATLDTVVVRVTRNAERSVLRSPFAITIVQPDSARPGQLHNSIDETLALVPGLVVASRNNPTQDPRLSIRGFGSRSTFGVRGVRVMRDGIPLTLPDGQTPLDYVSLESVGSVEVLRGAASALYGNAGGGVIDLRTVPPSRSPFSADVRQFIGSNSFSRSVLAVSGSSNDAGYVADIAHNRSDGSRDHSRQKSTSGFARGAWKAGDTDLSLSVLALRNPLSENPGALTIEEMEANPEQADALSIRRDASKAVKQFQIGVSGSQRIGQSSFSASLFGGARSLDNPLTFAVVEIGRHSYGGSASARSSFRAAGATHSLALGVDYQKQNDLRRNFAACADTIVITVPTTSCPFPGENRGIVSLDQRELISSVGVYLGDDIAVTDRIGFAAAVRGDRVNFRVEDRLVAGANPDDSGDRTLSAISPVAGLIFRTGLTQSLYLNVSTAFETPTATELGNHPDGSAGINQELDPQKSTTYEAGAKGWAGPVRYDASVFTTSVEDELIPFEIPASNGRRYFRNAGRTSRRGVEAGVESIAGPVRINATYTYSRFRFADYSFAGSDFSDKTIPGIPSHRAQAAITAGSNGRYLTLELEAAGKAWVDDANTTEADNYAVAGARGGFSTTGRIRLAVFAGIQNLFDKVYASSLAVNAARGKYYEPASRRTFYAAVSLAGIH